MAAALRHKVPAMKAPGGPRGGIGLCFAACIAALALPGSTLAAKPHHRHHTVTEVVVEPPEEPRAEFRVRGSNGYRIEVEMTNEGASLDAQRNFGPGGESQEAARYQQFAAIATMSRASANFGRVGRVSVRFNPSGRKSVFRDPECKGGPETVRYGTFEGTIRFEGEEGFTRFVAKKVKGEVTYTPRQVCRFQIEVGPHHHDRPEREPVITEWFAAARDPSQGPDAYTIFEASNDQENPAIAEFSAERAESRGELSIERTIAVNAPATAFAFDAELNSATLAPPAPFAGSATFTRIDNFATRWEGPLTVSFPGAANVPLTGRGFSWSLDREGG